MIPRAEIGFILVPIGLILAIFGMLCFTGILDIDVPSLVMYLGFAVTIVGLVVLYLDLKENESVLMEYEKKNQKKGTHRSSKSSKKH